MSTVINQNYSQFYAGTESLKSYGSNSALKRDTLVRYAFNTTDEQGNKVMDKMSKEETFQAIKGIRSQYGDDVIVQLSGNALASLAGNKYSGQSPDLDNIMNGEQGAIPEDMVTQLEGTHHMVSENGKIDTRLDWHETLREKAPDVCDAFDDLMQRILDHALNHSDDGESFAKEFIEMVTKAEKALEAAQNQNDNKAEEKAEEEAEDDMTGTSGCVGINAAKLARMLAAAKTRSQVQAVIAKIQADLRECDAGKARGMDVDEASVQAAERLLQEAKSRLGSADNREATPVEEMASALASLM